MAVIAYLVGLLTGILLMLAGWRRRERRLLTLTQATSWSAALTRLRQLLSDQPEQPIQLPDLGNSRDTLEQILQAAPVGYLQVDEENQLNWCNNEAARLLRISQPLAGPVERPRLLLEVARSYELDSLIDQARQNQAPCQQEWMLYQISPDPMHPKEEPTYPLRGYALPLNHGQVGVFLENRQEAALLIRQRDRWTSDVAHELRTPLTSIRLVAETLQSRVEPGLKTWLDRLVNEAIRLGNLVEDLLKLSRLQTDQLQGLHLTLVDLPQLIQSAWQSLEPLATVKHLHLNYSGPGQYQARLDKALFHRVLLNLIDNAIKHSPPEAPVYIQLSALNPEVESNHSHSDGFILEVIDGGSGFNSRDLPYVFDRFYRADPSRSRSVGLASSLPASAVSIDLGEDVNRGTGLGLAIVSQIVAAHGGTITAANHPDRGGGHLRVTMPSIISPSPSP
ncbi:MAG: HAMP domain-containing histidine kinase [Nodosilinea sp. LVE1205-7]